MDDCRTDGPSLVAVSPPLKRKTAEQNRATGEPPISSTTSSEKDRRSSEKERQRSDARALRCALTPQRRRQAAASAATQFLGLPALRTARRVLVYAPLPDELDPLLWYKQWPENVPGAPAPQLAWPRVADRRQATLTLHLCGQDDLEPGSFKLREPPATAPQMTLADLDVVLVPGLAFDKTGQRLGYGQGYYDRLLAHRPEGLVTVGLCFKETLLPHIIHDARDIPVSYVISA